MYLYIDFIYMYLYVYIHTHDLDDSLHVSSKYLCVCVLFYQKGAAAG